MLAVPESTRRAEAHGLGSPGMLGAAHCPLFLAPGLRPCMPTCCEVQGLRKGATGLLTLGGVAADPLCAAGMAWLPIKI